VEYERVSALKLRFLKLGFAQFLRERRTGSARARAFEAFREREGDLLETFATYCALDEEMHRRDPDVWVWTDWPAPYQDPRSAETRAFGKKRWRRVMFYQYLQWQIDLQLAGAQQWARDRHLSIGLYHDMALATDRFGTGRSMWPGAVWVRRPTISLRRARTGRFRHRIRRAIARTGTGCSRSPFARTAGAVGRCVSIT
jgi:4-alpha-glucanotransferase